MTAVSYTKSSPDADPDLSIDGESVPAKTNVTWTARGIALVMEGCFAAGAKAYRDQLEAAWPEIVAAIKAQPAPLRMEIAGLSELLNAVKPPPVQQVEVVASPARVSHRKVVRDKQGRVVEAIGVEEDATVDG